MNIRKILFLLSSAVMVMASCKKTDLEMAPRLFRPTVSAAGLVSEANSIQASWSNIKGSTSYTLQVSRDSFKTVDVTLNLDTTSVLVPNLKWDQMYQVQVKANAGDSSMSSRWASLGSIKTPKFPTILKSPTISDVTDEAIRVSWTNSGAAVTSIKVLKSPDSTFVRDVALTATDVTNQYKVISGLTPNTPYIILLYSGSTLRGYDIYNTKAPLTGTIVDLRNITDRPSVLADTLPLIEAGSTVLLKRGMTYNISGVNIGKAVTIQSGSDLTITVPATISLTSGFNFALGSSIDYINFKEVNLIGASYTASYVFNTTNSANVASVSFENCRAEIFRGLFRMQSGTGTVTNFSINNCIIDSIGSFGVLQIGSSSVNTLKIENISIKNSTIYKTEFIIASTAPSTSVVFDNLTLNEIPLAAKYLVDYSATIAVPGGITMTNCIVGSGKAGTTAGRGIRAGATGATPITASNNYNTSDYGITANLIPNIIPYAKKSTEIWEAPTSATGASFRLIDPLFPGRNSAGDPRWRP